MDRQAKIAATMRAGMAIRRNASPASKVSLAEASPLKRAKLDTETSKQDGAGESASLSPVRRQLISLPEIPTGCTPPRPSNASRSRQASPILQVHATLRSESDVELLGSPSPARPARPARPAVESVNIDLTQRVRELEAKLLEMAQPKPASPKRRVSFPALPETPRRGRSERRANRSRPAASSPRRSVFDRLGDRDDDLGNRRSPSPGSDKSPERDVATDVSWSTMVDLGLCLSGRERSPSPDYSNADGLLASQQPVRSRHTFPPSKGVMDSLHKSFKKYTGEDDVQDCRPESLPSEATSHLAASKFVRAFNPRFHGGNSFPLHLQAPKPSTEESSYLRNKVEPAVPISKVGDVEQLLRRAMRTINTLDWLLATLREVSRLPHQDQHVLDALWGNVQRTLAFSTDFTSAAFLTSLIARREAFLKSCDPMKVPRRTHTWAALRSPFSAVRQSLLGDTGDVFRLASREERELAIVNSLSSNRSAQGQRRDQSARTPRVASTVSRPQASYSNNQPRGRSNANNNNSGSSSYSRPARGRGGANRRH